MTDHATITPITPSVHTLEARGHEQYGMANAAYLPAAHIEAGAEIDPTMPLEGRRHLFDICTEAGRKAYEQAQYVREKGTEAKARYFQRKDAAEA